MCSKKTFFLLPCSTAHVMGCTGGKTCTWRTGYWCWVLVLGTGWVSGYSRFTAPGYFTATTRTRCTSAFHGPVPDCTNWDSSLLNEKILCFDGVKETCEDISILNLQFIVVESTVYTPNYMVEVIRIKKNSFMFKMCSLYYLNKVKMTRCTTR